MPVRRASGRAGPGRTGPDLVPIASRAVSTPSAFGYTRAGARPAPLACALSTPNTPPPEWGGRTGYPEDGLALRHVHGPQQLATRRSRAGEEKHEQLHQRGELRLGLRLRQLGIDSRTCGCAFEHSGELAGGD